MSKKIKKLKAKAWFSPLNLLAKLKHGAKIRIAVLHELYIQ